MKPSVTLAEVLDWYPCYPIYKVEALFAGRRCLTAADIAVLDVPAEDRVWALLHNPLASSQQLRLLACDFADGRIQVCSRAGSRVSVAVGAHYGSAKGQTARLRPLASLVTRLHCKQVI